MINISIRVHRACSELIECSLNVFKMTLFGAQSFSHLDPSLICTSTSPRSTN